jgi:hypothetical protein
MADASVPMVLWGRAKCPGVTVLKSPAGPRRDGLVNCAGVTVISLRICLPPADRKAGWPHYRSVGPDGLRHKVPETAAVGPAPPGQSAVVAGGGLA